MPGMMKLRGAVEPVKLAALPFSWTRWQSSLFVRPFLNIMTLMLLSDSNILSLLCMASSRRMSSVYSGVRYTSYLQAAANSMRYLEGICQSFFCVPAATIEPLMELFLECPEDFRA